MSVWSHRNNFITLMHDIDSRGDYACVGAVGVYIHTHIERERCMCIYVYISTSVPSGQFCSELKIALKKKSMETTAKKVICSQCFWFYLHPYSHLNISKTWRHFYRERIFCSAQ